MKEDELIKVSKCIVCGKPFGHTGLPLFWRITIERFGVDMRAIRRQEGLIMMLGGNMSLASAMGPDEDMTKPMMDPITVTICETCAMEQVCVAELVER